MGFVLALISVALVLVGAGFAYMDRMFLPSQMVERYPRGFPFIANGAMWGNLVLISLVLFVMGKYEGKWGGTETMLAFSVGMVISFAMFYFIYSRGKFPDSLAGGCRPISLAGWTQVFYFGWVLAAIFLFYFCSHATTKDVVRVGVLLAVYIIVANHVPLHYVRKWSYMPWCPRIFPGESSPLRIIICGEILVTVATIIKLL